MAKRESKSMKTRRIKRGQKNPKKLFFYLKQIQFFLVKIKTSDWFLEPPAIIAKSSAKTDNWRAKETLNCVCIVDKYPCQWCWGENSFWESPSSTHTHTPIIACRTPAGGTQILLQTLMLHSWCWNCAPLARRSSQLATERLITTATGDLTFWMYCACE